MSDRFSVRVLFHARADAFIELLRDEAGLVLAPTLRETPTLVVRQAHGESVGAPR